MAHEAQNHPAFVQGRDRLARVVRMLVQLNDFTHTDIQDFYRWSCGDDADRKTWLNRSQISTLRNSKLPKPGPQIFMGLASINLRLAQLAGEDGPAIDGLPKLGPLPPNLARLADEKPFFMRNPHTDLPMDEGDFFRLYCGTLPMLDETWDELPSVYTDEDGARISQRLALWAQRWMIAQGKTPLECKGQFLEPYPIPGEKRRDRLWQVVLGMARYSGKDLAEERDSLRFLIGHHETGAAYGIREFDRWCKGLDA